MGDYDNKSRRIGSGESMRGIYIYLGILNALDALATCLGLNAGLIEEANPVMGGLYEKGPLLFLLVKISFSALLGCFAYMKYLPETKLLKNLLLLSSFLYTAVCLLHLYWIASHI
ncbi:DUF5658 family protein [Bacillus infantis]|uniref:DUF5658 domain-containing protein n=2 Tax=Bacillaceae TaxID=186817 RepID=U5LCH0_9BACI|nr:DUF5658 family protein [Bacillus infantis]AGX05155.1 hypothetical protein N288_16330 [Bacillus infantis NRRL B-14911]EAR63837.1 hypothetical protein B14911_22622 [Bacillus sp. NRRL B-14911]OXT19433.1 hypothetical protein B9K06_03495 [Bacillus sp. OG2]MCK6204764.1 hypothetical protein [Bacillus infantis]RYI31147.1 hypothetical protein EVU96_03755 [Bacillus infantis]